ncbi:MULTISPECIES: hypothetical protein [Oceanobacillus]|uniref:Uncharacterized protein n=2 Tax=Oceanobacillus TaxID=182709 RepID=A0A0A1MEU7_9BACI|nr:hypothetical protein [Oceanobacillus oncorhynchi]MDM8102217.1 hypothetical protein [Oceanobacillus oncorhynchi]CEI81628.1 hypothetical protein BN997_01463 [Oceanobacillus oncorhynchi]
MTTNQAKQQTRTLILGLGVLALIRPLMKITGLIHIFGSEAIGSIAMIILISIAWILIVIKKRVSNPIPVLVLAGVSYAAFAIILSGILSPVLDGGLQGPLTNPIALVSVFITNIVWGFVLGVIAAAIPYKKG